MPITKITNPDSALASKLASAKYHHISFFAQKVRKTPDFVMKSGAFMVAEAGLEPTTSGL